MSTIDPKNEYWRVSTTRGLLSSMSMLRIRYMKRLKLLEFTCITHHPGYPFSTVSTKIKLAVAHILFLKPKYNVCSRFISPGFKVLYETLYCRKKM